MPPARTRPSDNATGPALPARAAAPATDGRRVIDPLPLKVLVLAGLAFHGVTMILYVLARQRQNAVERHDLIRAARQRRLDYLKTVDDRRDTLNAMRPQRQTKPFGLAEPAPDDRADLPFAPAAANPEPPLAKAA